MANFLDTKTSTDFARSFLVALSKRRYSSLNEVHGRILVIQCFLLGKQPDSLAAFVGLSRQFSNAATSQDWPFLIRDGLLDIADALGNHAVSNDPQGNTALARSSDVDHFGSLRRLVDGQAIASAELLDILPLLEKNPSTILQHNLPERLYQTYTETSNIPLREALLPVLGQATVSIWRAVICRCVVILQIS
jgi:hypothetical protein